MSAYIIPIIFISLFCYARSKKVNTYDTFVRGAKKAIPLAVDIFPFVAAIMIAVALLRASGLTAIIADACSPVFNFLGIPTELVELVLLRPFTGSGSFALLDSVLTQYGADSYIARCACVIYGSSETVFYIAAVYFAGAKTKNLAKPIIISLVASFASCIFACFICYIM